MKRRRDHATTSSILHSPAGYDLLTWFLHLGRARVFRERLARLEPGESVLAVGCGTGSLVIAAKHLGLFGWVAGPFRRRFRNRS